MPIYSLPAFKPTEYRHGITKTAIKRNMAAGFTFAWTVHERYTVKDAMLCAEGKERLTLPANEGELAVALARVHERLITPEEFVAQYGLLEKRGGAESLDRFHAHAKTVCTIVHLLAAIADRDINQIRFLFHSGQCDFATVSWPRKPVRTAQEYVAGLLTAGLEKTHVKLSVVQDRIYPIFQPHSLIDVIYWQLGNCAVDRNKIRRCPTCHAFFIATDARSVYCPTKNCSMRMRVKRFRERH